jgi:hypothetical protein
MSELPPNRPRISQSSVDECVGDMVRLSTYAADGQISHSPVTVRFYSNPFPLPPVYQSVMAINAPARDGTFS